MWLRARGSLVNIILVFGRNNDRNVQRFVNGRSGDRLWTYLCISSNVFGPKNHKRTFWALHTVILNVK